MTKVLYTMGAGRSGSTVLGIALGNLGSVFYAGELFAWPLFGGKPKTEKKPTLAFWKKVGEGISDRERHFQAPYHRRLEHPSALVRPWVFLGSELARDHARYHAEFFARIEAESGAEVIVDSSHYPLRLVKLRKIPSLDVFVIYLVRDPRQVISALQKETQRSQPMHPFKANIYCLTVWLLSLIAYLSTPAARRIKVRYEDFTRDPDAAVQKIADRFGIEDDLHDFDDLEVGHVFQANRIRHLEVVSVRNEASELNLSRGWSLASTLMQLPVLLTNRYL